MQTGYTPIQTVTPKSLRTLKKYELVETDKPTLTRKLLDIYVDEDPTVLIELCDALFEEDFSKVESEAIDLEVVSKGLTDFFSRVLGGSKS